MAGMERAASASRFTPDETSKLTPQQAQAPAPRLQAQAKAQTQSTDMSQDGLQARLQSLNVRVKAVILVADRERFMMTSGAKSLQTLQRVHATLAALVEKQDPRDTNKIKVGLEDFHTKVVESRVRSQSSDELMIKNAQVLADLRMSVEATRPIVDANRSKAELVKLDALVKKIDIALMENRRHQLDSKNTAKATQDLLNNVPTPQTELASSGTLFPPSDPIDVFNSKQISYIALICMAHDLDVAMNLVNTISSLISFEVASAPPPFKGLTLEYRQINLKFMLLYVMYVLSVLDDHMYDTVMQLPQLYLSSRAGLARLSPTDTSVNVKEHCMGQHFVGEKIHKIFEQMQQKMRDSEPIEVNTEWSFSRDLEPQPQPQFQSQSGGRDRDQSCVSVSKLVRKGSRLFR